jgi:anhydro-N-acetylmuramic acid kinase
MNPRPKRAVRAPPQRVIRWTEVRAMAMRNVAGLMSGTSMDGLDVALCRITSAPKLGFELVAFETVPFPAGLRQAMAAERLQGLAAIARLDGTLGRFFAEALASVLDRHAFELQLIGSHGQTVYHEHAVTSLQLGQPAPLAERFGCPVVHDFRANDIAAGGAGAPLVPYVDWRVLAERGEAILAVNIGGIANFTALPRGGGRVDELIGMDCGPGNMVLDQLAERFSAGAQSADVDGRLAARGRVREDLLAVLSGHPFFALAPPKSAGREQFGPPFVDALLAEAKPRGEQDWCDLMATAAELTAFGIHEAYRRYVASRLRVDAVMVSGGGARNPEVMARLGARFDPIPVGRSDAYGLPVDAKEAIAFALLASERLDERPANVPSVTGARRQVLLGKITEC